jgi:alkanesulfonate monooxygenase
LGRIGRRNRGYDLVTRFGCIPQGSPGELCEAFLEYKRIGVAQFIISGWPKLDEMLIFGREVLPLIRDAERDRESQ